tara:strand:- start:344 stop:1027 length:684 start_codon:yes stop_codon:yes gene_type:complete
MIILTGSTGGIGSEVLKELSLIDSVFAIYNSTKPNNENLKLNNVEFYKLDVTSEQEIFKFIELNKNRFKNLTLINLAGVSSDGLLINFNQDDWEKVFKINITSNFLLSKYLIPFMIKDKWGRIIHFSSIASGQGVGAYSSSKEAINGLSKSISKEYGRFNITSNVLKLGAFDIGMLSKLSTKEKKSFTNAIPNKTLGAVDNIVNAINFIIKSNFLNGSSITIDGGAT